MKKLLTLLLATIAGFGIVRGETIDLSTLQQDEDGYYLIASVDDWKAFATLIETEPTSNARMTADIDLGDDQTMIGSGQAANDYGGTGSIKYQGIFDGQGHTLTINYVASNDHTAPFRYIQNATIKNLHVQGSITTSYGCAAGIVGICYGQQIHSYVENCISSVEINSSYENNGGFYSGASHGGVVANLNYYGQLHITDCIFDGSIQGENKDVVWGGMMGIPDGTVTLTNCLQVGEFNCSGVIGGSNGSGTFSCVFGNGYASRVNVVNCYYLNQLGNAQGTQLTAEQLADGTIATALQADREEEIWVQNPLTNQPTLKVFPQNAAPEPIIKVTQKLLTAKRLADMNTARMCHQIMPVEDGIVVFGGHTPGFSMTKTAERYNFATNTWTQMNMLYYQDYSAGIVTADGKMLLAGGMSGNSGTGASAQCELYDPTTNTFTSTGSMVQARSMATATMTKSGKIYVNGCWYNSSYALECYDPETGSFSKAADGMAAYHPNLMALRGERVAIADGSYLAVAENGTTTNVESDLLAEYPIMKGWDEMQMTYYQVADYSYILLGRSDTQTVLLNVYDDATEGVKISKVADLPMTLPDNESVQIGYHDQVSRVFIDKVSQKLYVQTCILDDGKSPVIVEYDYPSALHLRGGNIVVYATDKPLEHRTENAAWTMLADGTLASVGGGNSNFDPHNAAYIYTLGGEDEQNELAKDENGYYLIASVDDWKAFATLVETEPTANARMTADIDLGDDQTKIGTQTIFYQGTFDGQGHTLTVNYNQDIELALAPFCTVSNATIKKLHVAGSIKQQFCAAGGVVGTIKGDLNVSECWVSAYLYVQGRGNYQGTIGGIASYCDDPAITDHKIVIEDCIFSGEIANGQHCGSIMSHVNGEYGNHATIKNCLNIGTYPGGYSSTGTFIRPIQGSNFEIDNCYYKTVYGYAQGIQLTDEQLADGTIATALQADREEQVWVQDLDLNQPMLRVFAQNPAPDGINSLMLDPSRDTQEIYDLQGRKVQKLQKGLYIIDGQKVFVK